ncbi:hypothetical protein [Shewanella surugensis]|uniref:Uncharacterized protein n=1 Tax=Shewanella surugensis TaxID=212020 RepID=A0ABT0L6Q4_9GAMM|nr:hypothetical protein [Shewanella surugensis]MCL1123356.1 hypothetical protein [Shewanella surugensis]
MHKYVNKDPQSQSHSLNNKFSQKKSPLKHSFIDNRPEAALQRKYQEILDG